MSEYLSAQSRVEERIPLYEVLPLQVPFSISMFVSNNCNFKCFYCPQAIEETKGQKAIKHGMMDFELYKANIDQIAAMGRLKLLTLVGYGEPLLHPHIAEMVAYAVQREVADTVQILTNASMLTPALSDALIEAGLGRLFVSLQGLDAKGYWETSHYKLDYEQFQNQIRYYYEHKKQNMKICVKIMDVMVQKPEEKELFFRQYQDICDQMTVETLCPINESECEEKGGTRTTSVYGLPMEGNQICAKPFFSFIVQPDGSVTPCCNCKMPQTFEHTLGGGGVSLSAIWNGAEYRAFLRMLLQGKNVTNPVCAQCETRKYMLLPSDMLDGHEEVLLKRYDF